MEELTILRTDSESNVDFPTLGGWAPLTAELFKGQWYIYMCVSVYLFYTHICAKSLATYQLGWSRGK